MQNTFSDIVGGHDKMLQNWNLEASFWKVMETKCVSYHIKYDMMLHAFVVTGWPQKILKNDKTVIYDLVTTAGPAGL